MMIFNIYKIIILALLGLLLVGCAGMGMIGDNKPETSRSPLLSPPPPPKQSTCVPGKIDSIIISADGNGKIWYYSNNSYLSIDFRSIGVNVKIQKATDTDFCYDYF